MPDFILPEDFSQFTQSPDAEWKALEHQGAAARARSVDLIGQLWLEEEAKGKAGWRPRVQMRLGLGGMDSDAKKALNTIGDYARIFKVFRLGGDTGLGWRLDELAGHNFRALRVFTNYGEWTVRNPDRVRNMLASGRPEAQLRAEIKEAVAAEREGREEMDPEEKAPEFVNFILRLTPQDAALLRTTLDGVLARAEERGNAISDSEAAAYGDAVLQIAGDWFNGQSIMTRNGKPVHVENAEFVARAANEAMPDLGTDAEGADDIEDEDGPAF